MIEVKEILKSVVVAGFLSIFAFAQYGTAPTNYYPVDYSGTLFTGVVTGATANQITLTFSKGSKTETFTGLFETGCSVPTKQKDGPLMWPGDIPTGTKMTAFYNARTRKINGNKVKEYIVIAVSFDSWHGHALVEDNKKIYLCTDNHYLQFKAF